MHTYLICTDKTTYDLLRKRVFYDDNAKGNRIIRLINRVFRILFGHVEPSLVRAYYMNNKVMDSIEEVSPSEFLTTQGAQIEDKSLSYEQIQAV